MPKTIQKHERERPTFAAAETGSTNGQMQFNRPMPKVVCTLSAKRVALRKALHKTLKN